MFPFVRHGLMIVAHPDDETIFGGQEFFSEVIWHVICLTNAGNAKRNKAFNNAMDFVGATREIWDYPDEPGWSKRPEAARLAWQPVVSEIHDRLSRYLAKANFTKFVTHSNSGEYGHEHHKLAHEIVLSIVGRKQLEVFALNNHYIEPEILKCKLRLMSIYGQQISEKECVTLNDWICRGTTQFLGQDLGKL